MSRRRMTDGEIKVIFLGIFLLFVILLFNGGMGALYQSVFVVVGGYVGFRIWQKRKKGKKEVVSNRDDRLVVKRVKSDKDSCYIPELDDKADKHMLKTVSDVQREFKKDSIDAHAFSKLINAPVLCAELWDVYALLKAKYRQERQRKSRLPANIRKVTKGDIYRSLTDEESKNFYKFI